MCTNYYSGITRGHSNSEVAASHYEVLIENIVTVHSLHLDNETAVVTEDYKSTLYLHMINSFFNLMFNPERDGEKKLVALLQQLQIHWGKLNRLNYYMVPVIELRRAYS